MPSKPPKSQAKAERAPPKKAPVSEEKPKRKRGRPKGSKDKVKRATTKRAPPVLEEEVMPEGLTRPDVLSVKEQETEGRIAQIDKAIRSMGWTPALCMALARQWNISERAVYRLRTRTLDRMREAEDLDLPTRRAQFLAEVREVRRKALDAGRFGPATACLKMEGQVMGVFRPLELDVVVNPQAQKTDAELAELVKVEAARLEGKPGRGQVIEAKFSEAK